jgi:hypothetical protein
MLDLVGGAVFAVVAPGKHDVRIEILTAHFLNKHGGERPPSLSPEALDVMGEYGWPGNVRELENAVLHAIALHHGEVIGQESLPNQITGRTTKAEAISEDEALTPLTEAKRRASATFEKRYLTKVMERSKGSVSEAARLAGAIRRTPLAVAPRHASVARRAHARHPARGGCERRDTRPRPTTWIGSEGRRARGLLQFLRSWFASAFV